MEVCIARGGVRKGLRVATFICQWTMAQQSLGRVPMVREYSRWWREPERTTYKYLSEFREIFPELETPAPIATAAIEGAGERWTIKDVGRLPLGVAV